MLSAYPLSVHVLVNNVYRIVTGKDTSVKPTHRFARFDIVFRSILRLICASVPILMAFGVSNFITVAKYSGLLDFIISTGSPMALQLGSIYLCKKTFGNRSKLANQSIDIKLEELNSDQKSIAQQPSHSRSIRSLYMTPYSNRLLSHPIAVCVFGVLGFVMFSLTFASLFLSQETEVCFAEVESTAFFSDY